MFFFLVLLLTLTLIYVSLVNTTIKIEFFIDPADMSNNSSLNSIAQKLGINNEKKMQTSSHRDSPGSNRNNYR